MKTGQKILSIYVYIGVALIVSSIIIAGIFGPYLENEFKRTQIYMAQNLGCDTSQIVKNETWANFTINKTTIYVIVKPSKKGATPVKYEMITRVWFKRKFMRTMLRDSHLIFR